MKITIIPILLLGFMFGCQSNADTDSEKLIQAINGFGIDLYKELIKTDDNLICSAFSVNTVLSMLLVGARTTSRTELRNVLGYEKNAGLSDVSIMEKYHQLLTQQRSEKNDYELDVANSMWINENFDVNHNFTQAIRDNFYAEEQEVNFGSPQATDTINNWVSAATKGKIPKLFDKPLDVLTRLVLANAIYFKGTWVTKFNSTLTNNEPFKFNDGNSEKDVQMMRVVSKFNYADSDELNAQVLEMPYNGNDVSMFVFLPKDVSGLTSLQQKLTQVNVGRAFDRLSNREVHVKIPKFKSASTLELNPVLENLGINKIFSESEADLSGINGKRDLSVSIVIQKAIIEVSEEGTIATVSSGAAVILRIQSQPPPNKIYFTADHPFLYFIVHKPTGLALFAGRFVKP